MRSSGPRESVAQLVRQQTSERRDACRIESVGTSGSGARESGRSERIVNEPSANLIGHERGPQRADVLVGPDEIADESEEVERVDRERGSGVEGLPVTEHEQAVEVDVR